MKKFIYTLILSVSLFSIVSASSWNVETGEVEILATPISISSWIEENQTVSSWVTSSTNPIENTSYIYYYGQGCPYCQQFQKYMESVWWFDKLNIDKREVWYNAENQTKMAEDIQRLWIVSEQIWVPFMVINQWGEESYISWLDGLLSHFEPILGKYSEETISKIEAEKKLIQSEQNKWKTYVFLIIILILAVWIPAIFILPKNKK